MIQKKSIHLELANILRQIGSEKCIEKAQMLETEPTVTRTWALRDLDLDPSHITSIVSCFKQKSYEYLITSISFSYNHLLSDSGAIILANNLPTSIREIGLVNCGIGDRGGVAILDWMRNSPKLQMICMEQNNFSEKLSVEIEKYKTANPQVVVVY